MPVCCSSLQGRSLGVDLLELDQCIHVACFFIITGSCNKFFPSSSSSFYFFSGQTSTFFFFLPIITSIITALADQLARSSKQWLNQLPSPTLLPPIIICTKLHSCATSQAPNYGASSRVLGSRITYLYLLTYLLSTHKMIQACCNTLPNASKLPIIISIRHFKL